MMMPIDDEAETTDRAHPQRSTLVLLTSLCVVLLVLLVAAQAWQTFRGVAAQRQQWQYAIEAPPDAELGQRLRELGLEGWEIVTARRASSSEPGTTGDKTKFAYEMILRRPVIAEEPARFVFV